MAPLVAGTLPGRSTAAHRFTTVTPWYFVRS